MLLPKNIFIPVDQYQENTSQWLKSRSEETLHVDNCYARLLLVPTEANARALFDALDGYVGGKGGDWNKVSRNKSSDGLLGRMYNWLKLELKIINAIDFAIFDREVPSARFGTLYFFGNIRISMNKMSLGLEGLAVAGGLMNSSDAFKAIKVGDVDLGSHLGGVHHVNAGNVTALSAGTLNVAAGAVRSQGSREVKIFRSTLPSSLEELEVAAVNADAQIATVRAASAESATLVVRLQAAIESATNSVIDFIMAKTLNKSRLIYRIGGIVARVALCHVLASCVPFLSSAFKALTGLTNAIRATEHVVKNAYLRYQVSLLNGTPSQIANGIMEAMALGIGKGVYQVIAGGLSIAGEVSTLGAGAVASALIAAVEFIIKTLWRYDELEQINIWLQQAEREWDRELKISSTELIGLASLPEFADPSVPRYRLNPDRKCGSIIYDDVRFKKFFDAGCSASPLIPMLALNSGICVNFMTWCRLTKDDTVSSVTISQNEFDRGIELKDNLRHYSNRYFDRCGFVFEGKSEDSTTAVKYAVTAHLPPSTWQENLTALLGADY
jgi:hypothetical protein